MSKELSNKAVLFLVFVMILLPEISLAFNDETRCQMVKDAIRLSPKYLKAHLTANFQAVHQGIHFADRNKQVRNSIRVDDIKISYDRIVASLRQGKENDFDTNHRFGLLACFVAETISPSNFKTNTSLVPKKAVYDGFHKVDKVDANASRLIVKYRKPYKHSRDRKVTDYLYNVALNQIVDHWISAWQAGGKAPGLLVARGTKISHESQVILLKGKA